MSGQGMNRMGAFEEVGRTMYDQKASRWWRTWGLMHDANRIDHLAVQDMEGPESPTLTTGMIMPDRRAMEEHHGIPAEQLYAIIEHRRVAIRGLEAKIIDRAREVVSPFAVAGLAVGLHERRQLVMPRDGYHDERRDIAITAVRTMVRLQELDDAITEHRGDMLTVVNGMKSVVAGRLAPECSITISQDNRLIRIPTLGAVISREEELDERRETEEDGLVLPLYDTIAHYPAEVHDIRLLHTTHATMSLVEFYSGELHGTETISYMNDEERHIFGPPLERRLLNVHALHERIRTTNRLRGIE